MKRRRKVQNRIVKRFMLCREIPVYDKKYDKKNKKEDDGRIWLDAGAIHRTLKLAKEHLRSCDGQNSLVILPVYRLMKIVMLMVCCAACTGCQISEVTDERPVLASAAEIQEISQPMVMEEGCITTNEMEKSLKWYGEHANVRIVAIAASDDPTFRQMVMAVRGEKRTKPMVDITPMIVAALKAAELDRVAEAKKVAEAGAKTDR